MRKIIAIDSVSGEIVYKDNGRYFYQGVEKPGIKEISRAKASLFVYAFRYFNCCYAPKNY